VFFVATLGNGIHPRSIDIAMKIKQYPWDINPRVFLVRLQ
jgi:hypothetical protein